jgi:hypothetical protein
MLHNQSRLPSASQFATVGGMTLDQALKVFGSRNRLAKALGVRRQAVTPWAKRIPMLRQYQIRDLTGGELGCDAPEVKSAPGSGA